MRKVYKNILPRSLENTLVAGLTTPLGFHSTAGEIISDLSDDDIFSHYIFDIIDNAIDTVRRNLDINERVYFATTDAPPGATAIHSAGVRIVVITWGLLVALYCAATKVVNDQALVDEIWHGRRNSPVKTGDGAFSLAVQSWYDGVGLPLTGDVFVILQTCVEFLLYHELGHLLAGHLGGPTSVAVLNLDENLYKRVLERDADSFAVARLLNQMIGRAGASRLIDTHLLNDVSNSISTAALAIILIVTTSFAYFDPTGTETMTTHPLPPFRIIDMQTYYEDMLVHIRNRGVTIDPTCVKAFDVAWDAIWGAIAREGHAELPDMEKYRVQWDDYASEHAAVMDLVLEDLNNRSFGNIKRRSI